MAIVVTHEAAAVALTRFYTAAESPIRDYSDRVADAMQAAIEAALPHLTDAGEPLAAAKALDGQWLADRFAKLDAHVSKLAELITEDQRGQIPARSEAERNTERAHRERMATIQAETEARVLAESVSYPTDYEVWRDALLIAAQRCPREESSPYQDRTDVEYEARGYVRSLRSLGQPPDPEDEFAPDDVLSFTEPDDDADDEEDCPNCGTEDDEHEEGCPKEADQ